MTVGELRMHLASIPDELQVVLKIKTAEGYMDVRSQSVQSDLKVATWDKLWDRALLEGDGTV